MAYADVHGRLVAMGLFATAVASAYDKHLPNHFSAGLCFIAAALAFVFSLLDFRNQQLVWLGEDILIYLERNSIFDNLAEFDGRLIFTSRWRVGTDAKVKFGILWRQKQEGGPKTNCWPLEWLRNHLSGKHRYLLREIAYIIALLFLIAGIWLWMQPNA